MTKLEEMAAFFEARLDGYEKQMTENVQGCREAYALIPTLLPPHTSTLLDLGCGTGLELDGIFARFPHAHVTGIDLSHGMLAELKRRHTGRDIALICANYFDVPLGLARFDAAVSVESLHHFEKRQKQQLYSRLHAALCEGGVYVECDYMVDTQAEEDALLAECARLRREQAIPEGMLCHFDTPCSISTQIALLREAGFTAVTQVMRIGGTAVLVAHK